MKKLFLMFALVTFIGANSMTQAAPICNLAKVECEKCGGKDGKCTKECKEGKKAKCDKKEKKHACSHAPEGAASEEGPAPKSCGAKKSCCKAKAKSAGKEEKEAAPAN